MKTAEMANLDLSRMICLLIEAILRAPQNASQRKSKNTMGRGFARMNLD
jgi:hypothetical protein